MILNPLSLNISTLLPSEQLAELFIVDVGSQGSSSNMTSRFNYRPDTVLGRSLNQPTDNQVLTAVDHPIDQLNVEDYIIANGRPAKKHRVGFYSQPTARSTDISEGGRPTFDRCSYFSVFVELNFQIDFQLDF